MQGILWYELVRIIYLILLIFNMLKSTKSQDKAGLSLLVRILSLGHIAKADPF
jgi:hypothetical protein